MASHPAHVNPSPTPIVVDEQVLHVRTDEIFQFVDVTELVEDCLNRSGVEAGCVNVQTRHTTAALMTNENEPLLIQDLKDRLRRWAPREARYRHNAFDRRKAPAGERPNGHAHTRALVLQTSETLNVRGGKLDLGRWQRLFLIELDGPRQRSVSVVIIGRHAASPRIRPAWSAASESA